MIVAVPLGLVASPLKSGRDLGEADRSALVVGGTQRIGIRDDVVFCKVVAVAEARVKRDGQVRAGGSPVRHATLGPLEEAACPGAVSRIAEDAMLDRRFVKGERERLLAGAFMIRAVVLMTLVPGTRAEDAVALLAGNLALVPGTKPWHPASARAAGKWRKALGPAPLEDLRDTALGASWRRPPGTRLPRRGHRRQDQAAEGRGDRRDPDPSAGHAREPGPASGRSGPEMTRRRSRRPGSCR